MSRLDVLGFTHGSALDFARDLRFDAKFDRDGAVIALFCTIIELTGSYLMLATDRRSAGTAAIFRQLFDAHIDFLNLMKDSKYIDNLDLDHCENWIKVLEASSQNRFLYLIAEYEHKEEMLQDNRAKRKALKDHGVKKLDAKAKFEKLKMGDEYTAIYKFQSMEVHNDIGALTRRHFKPLGDRLQVVLYDDVPIEYFDAPVNTITEILIHVMDLLNVRFAAGYDEKINELKINLLRTQETSTD